PDFNSIIVRLKLGGDEEALKFMCRFQFYNSSIKTSLRGRNFFQILLFQFYNSSIKTSFVGVIENIKLKFQFYNSSIKTAPKYTHFRLYSKEKAVDFTSTPNNAKTIGVRRQC
ncbi:hypothetical protein MNBD_IGNAVI01-2203, partial [hydrothermal vent metagenome]